MYICMYVCMYIYYCMYGGHSLHIIIIAYDIISTLFFAHVKRGKKDIISAAV